MDHQHEENCEFHWDLHRPGPCRICYVVPDDHRVAREYTQENPDK
jgi:hypothetical protein